MSFIFSTDEIMRLRSERPFINLGERREFGQIYQTSGGKAFRPSLCEEQTTCVIGMQS